MKAIAFTLLLAMLLAGCGSAASNPQSELEAVKSELAQVKQQVSSLQAQMPEDTSEPEELVRNTPEYLLSVSDFSDAQVNNIFAALERAGVLDYIEYFGSSVDSIEYFGSSEENSYAFFIGQGEEFYYQICVEFDGDDIVNMSGPTDIGVPYIIENGKFRDDYVFRSGN